MNLSREVEQLARRAIRTGLKRNNSTWLTVGGLSFLVARLWRRTPQVVYREELPVGTKLTIWHHDPND